MVQKSWYKFSSVGWVGWVDDGTVQMLTAGAAYPFRKSKQSIELPPSRKNQPNRPHKPPPRLRSFISQSIISQLFSPTTLLMLNNTHVPGRKQWVPGNTGRRSRWCGFAEGLGFSRAELEGMSIELGDFKMTLWAF